MHQSPTQILKDNITKKDTVVLAISGGPDSIYLLNLCATLSKTISKIRGFKIIVAHVNHQLRGKESDRDEQFVRALCKKEKLPFELERLGKIKKGNLEEESRIRRYKFFELIRDKYSAKWVITAHHRGDNIETVLNNMVRGSFLNGLTGMDTVCENRHLLRPMLNISKEEILKSLRKNKTKYRVDKSNEDTKYSRNLLRHKVIPLLREINPNFDETFHENMINIKETVDWLDTYIREWMEKNQTENGIILQNFLTLPEFLQKSVLAELYKRTNGNIRKFNRNHLQQILEILKSKKSGLKKEFGDNTFIYIQRPNGFKTHFITVNRPVLLKKKEKSLK